MTSIFSVKKKKKNQLKHDDISNGKIHSFLSPINN